MLAIWAGDWTCWVWGCLWLQKWFCLLKLWMSEDFPQTKAARNEGSGWPWTAGCYLSTAPKTLGWKISFLGKRAIAGSQVLGWKWARVRVSVERVKEPPSPGTLGMEIACQGDPCRAPTLLLLHLSQSGPPMVFGLWLSAHVVVGVVFSVLVVVGSLGKGCGQLFYLWKEPSLAARCPGPEMDPWCSSLTLHTIIVFMFTWWGQTWITSHQSLQIVQLCLLRSRTCCQSSICFVLGCLGRFSLSNVLTESVGVGPP